MKEGRKPVSRQLRVLDLEGPHQVIPTHVRGNDFRDDLKARVEIRNMTRDTWRLVRQDDDQAMLPLSQYLEDARNER